MRNGNLNVLKQLWEQPPAVAPETHSRPQETPQQRSANSSEPVNARNRETSDLAEPSAFSSSPPESTDDTQAGLESDSEQMMEKWMQRDVETPVVSSVPIEKPTVPLNSLKMMFEKGGDTFQNKVRTTISIQVFHTKMFMKSSYLINMRKAESGHAVGHMVSCFLRALLMFQ